MVFSPWSIGSNIHYDKSTHLVAVCLFVCLFPTFDVVLSARKYLSRCSPNGPPVPVKNYVEPLDMTIFRVMTG